MSQTHISGALEEAIGPLGSPHKLHPIDGSQTFAQVTRQICAQLER